MIPSATDPNYGKFEHLLSDGWIPGRKVDNSDAQYSSFRDNVPYLFIVMAIHPLLRRAFNAVYTSSESANGKCDSVPNGKGSLSGSNQSKADKRLDQRLTFDLLFGLVFLIALHGFSAPKVLIILYFNYILATKLGSDYVPTATWLFNIGILFANELARGYPYSKLFGLAIPTQPAVGQNNSDWGSFLDGYGGLIPRWEILFNITVLRLISFNFDYHWARNKPGSSSPVEVRQVLMDV